MACVGHLPQGAVTAIEVGEPHEDAADQLLHQPGARLCPRQRARGSEGGEDEVQQTGFGGQIAGPRG